MTIDLEPIVWYAIALIFAIAGKWECSVIVFCTREIIDAIKSKKP